MGGYPLDKRPASNRVFFPSHLKAHPAFSGHYEKTDPSLLLTYPLVMLTVSYWSHGPVEIVDLPLNMVIFHCYLKLPEGKPPFSYGFPMGFPMVIPQTWVTFCGSNPHIFGAELERTQITPRRDRENGAWPWRYFMTCRTNSTDASWWRWWVHGFMEDVTIWLVVISISNKWANALVPPTPFQGWRKESTWPWRGF